MQVLTTSETKFENMENQVPSMPHHRMSENLGQWTIMVKRLDTVNDPPSSKKATARMTDRSISHPCNVVPGVILNRQVGHAEQKRNTQVPEHVGADRTNILPDAIARKKCERLKELFRNFIDLKKAFL